MNKNKTKNKQKVHSEPISPQHDLKEYHDPLYQSQMYGSFVRGVISRTPFIIRLPCALVFFIIPTLIILYYVIVDLTRNNHDSVDKIVLGMASLFFILWFLVGVKMIVGERKS